MSRIGTTVVGLTGGILILWFLISRSAGMERVQDFKRIVNLHYPDRIHWKVPVQKFSETDYRSYFVDDGKWAVREFADCRFAAPPGAIEKYPGSETETIYGDQFTLLVGQNVAIAKSYERVVAFQEDLRTHVDDRFFAWKTFFMGKQEYKDYETSVTFACDIIGEADKVEIIHLNDGTVLTTHYCNLAKSRESSAIIVQPEKWKKRYEGVVSCYNSTQDVKDLIVYRCEDPQERDEAIHRIVATYACGSTTGTASDPPGE